MRIDKEANFSSLHEDLAHLPTSAGVYLMEDDTGKVIYVGKAVNLYKRVWSYFVGKRDLKVLLLRQRVRRVRVILCRDQYEALVLENNMIKRHKPFYNIELKDGKTYPLLRLTKEEFPRLFTTRERVEDGSSYYGPFPDAKRLQRYLQLMLQLFRLRRCHGPLPRREHPCIYYHTGHCDAPCVGKISAAEYRHQVQRLRILLSGRTGVLEKELQREMLKAAERLDYEQAGRCRDMLDAVRELLLEQPMQDFSQDKRDYVSMLREQDWCFFAVLTIRGGQVIGGESFHCQYPGDDDEALSEFLRSYYRQSWRELPEQVFVEAEADYSVLAQFLSVGREIPVQVLSARHPQRDRVLLQRALENARHERRQWLERHGNQHALAALRSSLNLARLPHTIEGFDISHADGQDTVAALVSFVDGRPEKSRYRYLRIKTLAARQIDDYQAMREAVARRYSRLLNEEQTLPDLVLIDGGKGQVSAAAEILQALGLEDLPVVGLAKREEWLYLAGQVEPLVLPAEHLGLRLLQYVRDEAHRFSNAFTRRRRVKKVKQRSLESVPGIGPKRSAKLLTTYGSLAKIARCPNEELIKNMHLSPELVATLKHYLEIWLNE